MTPWGARHEQEPRLFFVFPLSGPFERTNPFVDHGAPSRRAPGGQLAGNSGQPVSLWVAGGGRPPSFAVSAIPSLSPASPFSIIQEADVT